MIGTRSFVVLPLLAALSGCVAQSPVEPIAAPPPMGPEALYTPARVTSGRLEYAPDRSTFAPVLTERFPYPTQPQANAAYARLTAAALPDRSYPTSIWLFGCKPGALDDETVRIERYRGPVVHCATDFLDARGRRLGRETVNFYYLGKAWTMQPAYPPRTSVAWRNREGSPKDFWWWAPGRSRYE